MRAETDTAISPRVPCAVCLKPILCPNRPIRREKILCRLSDTFRSGYLLQISSPRFLLQKIKFPAARNLAAGVVEVTGFEPAASTSRTWRSTKLSHTSKSNYKFQIQNYKLQIAYAEKGRLNIISHLRRNVNTFGKIFLSLHGDIFQIRPKRFVKKTDGRD